MLKSLDEQIKHRQQWCIKQFQDGMSIRREKHGSTLQNAAVIWKRWCRVVYSNQNVRMKKIQLRKLSLKKNYVEYINYKNSDFLSGQKPFPYTRSISHISAFHSWRKGAWRIWYSEMTYSHGKSARGKHA